MQYKRPEDLIKMAFNCSGRIFMRAQGEKIDKMAFKMIQTSSLPQMKSSSFQTTTGNNCHKNFSCSLKICLTHAKGKKKKIIRKRQKKEKSYSKLSVSKPCKILSSILPRQFVL